MRPRTTPDIVTRTQVFLRTNITEPARKYDSSRGDLTHSFLLPKAPSTTLQAEIDEKLDMIEQSLQGTQHSEHLFAIRWRIVA